LSRPVARFFFFFFFYVNLLRLFHYLLLKDARNTEDLLSALTIYPLAHPPAYSAAVVQFHLRAHEDMKG